jgi:flagellar motility protein MotE (MotC chaperone)
MDSLKIVESSRLLPENIADSTLFGIGRHTEIFEGVEKSGDKLEMIHNSLDSLAKERKTLEDKEKAIDLKLNVLETNSDLSREENIKKLAKIYDSMKADQALPLIKNMNDTTAVSIISLMTERTASRLLGALAETDIEKATRLNKLLADIERIKK